jgi:hypothetical protein
MAVAIGEAGVSNRGQQRPFTSELSKKIRSTAARPFPKVLASSLSCHAEPRIASHVVDSPNSEHCLSDARASLMVIGLCMAFSLAGQGDRLRDFHEVPYFNDKFLANVIKGAAFGSNGG